MVVDAASNYYLHLADQNCSAIINNHLPTIEVTTRKKGELSEVGERYVTCTIL